MKEALFYKALKNKIAQCQLCPHFCVLKNGERGKCGVRENKNGKLFSLVYEKPCSLAFDPIEKKPFYHFLPGQRALSIATVGCNLKCKHCQNYEISQTKEIIGKEMKPEQIIKIAKEQNIKIISYTYTEPAIFYEYMLDIAKLAHKNGISNIYHSNGYLNQKPLEELIPYLDGANVDLKGFSEDFYKDITGGTLAPVLNTLKTLKKNGVWLEITNLVIPTKNDTEKMIKDMCEWIKNELGCEVPVHFSRFYPQYKLQNLSPTPIETLQKAAKIARKTKLLYIYIGNVPGIKEESTYCPKCKKILIERKGYDVRQINIIDGKCKFCKQNIPGHWK